MTDPLDKPLLHLTPGRFIGILVALLLTVFFLYLGNQYFLIGKAPSLQVASPEHNAIVSDSRVIVEGKTDTDATVTINGVSAIVRDDGRFYDRVAVDPGVNKIIIVATSRFGKTTTVERDVGYQP